MRSGLLAAILLTQAQTAVPVEQAAQQQQPQQAQSKIEAQHDKDLHSDVVLGARLAKEVAREYQTSDVLLFQQKVQRIGGQLAQIADTVPVKVLWGDKRLNPFEYTFTVLKGADVNAFSIPGGHVYVYEGLMRYAQSDDELAGVLAHEISHAESRHVATLERKSNSLGLMTIPLILLTILTHDPTAIVAGSLTTTALTNGWSEEAEESADYGGFQYLLRTNYNPTGMVTMMERLARDERNDPNIDYGIYRTHPPSRKRVLALLGYMKANHVAVERSKVTTSFRAAAKTENGVVSVFFEKRKLMDVGGKDAADRADAIVARLNRFYDGTPEMYEVQVDGDSLVTNGQPLVTITEADAALEHKSKKEVAADLLANVRATLFTLAYRVWDP